MKPHSHLSIGVIVPVYNTAPYVRIALASVLAQNCPDWRCLVVDDGSTDGSGRLADEACRIDSRFAIIHQRNAGQSAARNRALDRLTNVDWIAFLDSDDWLAPNALGDLRDMAEQHEADLVDADFFYVPEDWVPSSDKNHFDNPPRNLGVLPTKTFINRVAHFNRHMKGVVWAALWSRTLIGETRFPTLSIAEDLCFRLLLAPRTRRQVSNPRRANWKMMVYRQRTRSCVHTMLAAEHWMPLARELVRVGNFVLTSMPFSASQRRAFQVAMGTRLKVHFLGALRRSAQYSEASLEAMRQALCWIRDEGIPVLSCFPWRVRLQVRHFMRTGRIVAIRQKRVGK